MKDQPIDQALLGDNANPNLSPQRLTGAFGKTVNGFENVVFLMKKFLSPL
ncbi:MAG: hypothetical protein AB1589_21395 [Cyanobacteriota bacterium]